MEREKIVVTPTFNEADMIGRLIQEVLKICPDADILVVDDNSSDGTGEVVDAMVKKDERISCLHRRYKEGMGPAYIDGFKDGLKGNYQYIIQMDADFSNDPRYIPELLRLPKEYDLVIGSRYVKGGVSETGSF